MPPALRYVLLPALVLCLWTGSLNADETDGSRVILDIPSQNAEAAVKALARKARRSVMFQTDDVIAVKSNPLTGEYTLRGALQEMFEGTGLQGGLTKSGAIIVSPRKQQDASGGGEPMRTKPLGFFAALLSAFTATTAVAQDETAETEGRDIEEIVITGSLIRGVAPDSSASIQLSRDDIQANAGASTDQLLRSIPQMTTFNTISAVGTSTGGGGGAAGSRLSVNFANQTQQPSLRNVTAGGGGVGSTLILIDGHRVAGAGIFNPSPDPDIVPPSLLERVEVVLDGGSALYGSDAVGGVINFVTRSKFEGVEINVNHGVTDDYSAFNGNIAAGSAWDSGSVYLAYSNAGNDEVLGLDRDYIQSLDWLTGVPTGRQCSTGNVSVATRIYGLPGLALNDPNICDPTDYQTVMPEGERHSTFLGFSQELNDRIQFELRAFHTKRDTTANAGPLTANVNVNPGNAFYRNLPGQDAGATQSVQFNYAPVNGNDAGVNLTGLRQWGVTPSITVDLPGEWQARLHSSISQSRTTYRNAALNEALQTTYVNGATMDTALNPYDIAATPNQQLISDVLDWQRYGFARSRLVNHRAVFDGALFSIPGGELRSAVGIEYIRESYETRSGFTVRNGEGSLDLNDYSRDDVAVFGELNVPLISSGNNIPFVDALGVSASVRRDDYSDFGATTNPKVGVVYEPLDWLRLRTSWGKSFNAPSPSDQLASLDNSLSVLPFAFISPPGAPRPPFGVFSIVQFGAVSDLSPQEAESFSYGIDVMPPLLPGLSATANVYEILFEDQLGNPPFFNATEMFENYSEFVHLSPTAEQIAAAGASASGGDAAVAPFLAPGGPAVYVIVDARSRNLGRSKVRGLDFAATYEYVGSVNLDFGLSGNYQISRKFANSPDESLEDVDLDYFNRFRLSANAGITVGRFRAMATLNHLQGYKIDPSPTVHQSRVSSFNTVNLFFKYDIDQPLLANDMALTLNVDNVFDEDPPTLRSDGSTGITNGSTLGRLIQLGLNLRF